MALAAVAQALSEDYQTDPELTAIVSLDGDEFNVQRGEIWLILALFFNCQKYPVSCGFFQEALKMSMEGRNLMVGSFNSGDVFWGLAFFYENEPTPITLQAKLASKIILWSKETLQPIIMKNSKLSWEISRLMVTHMIRASAIVEGLAFQPVAGRVVAFLLENYPNEKQPQQRNLTLDEMAARTGTTSEMVCRLLQKFPVSGAIEITRTEFSIVDRQKLETISNKI